MEKVQRGSIILPALQVFAVLKGCADRYGHVVMMLMSCVFAQHTLETALLSASQEIEMGSDNPAAMQSVIQQRDLLESGLLSTCREISRVTAVSPNTTHTHTHRRLTLVVSIRHVVADRNLLFSKPGIGAVMEGV